MVRFCVADYDVIDGVDIQLFCQGSSVVIIEFFFRCFENDGFVSSLQDVGVICCTKFCVHDNVKYFQVFIQDACPIQVVFQLHSSHIIHLSNHFTRIYCQKIEGTLFCPLYEK